MDDAVDESPERAALVAEVRAWLSGHTHSPLTAPGSKGYTASAGNSLRVRRK